MYKTRSDSALVASGSVAAVDKEYLVQAGVSHVLNAAAGNNSDMLVDTDQDYYRDVGIRYLGLLSVLDLPKVDISRHFKVVADFIDSAVRTGGKS